MSPEPALPPLSADEIRREHEVYSLVASAIDAAGGAIPFAQFMDIALYAPGLGYYAGGRPKFGSEGDFVTAPELGSVFARCLARQCAEILAHTGGDIVEAGAGRGALAADLLLELDQLGSLPDFYCILEISSDLRELQRDTVGKRAPHLVNRIRWLEGWPANGIRGVIVGNELLDALPVERFRIRENGPVALGVGIDAESLVWREIAPPPRVFRRLAGLPLPVGYESEVGLQAEAWVATAASMLKQGVVLLIDYGFARPEYYHPDRHGGTLACHFRHRSHHNPFINLGLQDITAHVDFTAVAAAGTDAGLDVLGYATQGMFLVGTGLDEAMGDWNGLDDRRRLTLTSEIKKLTLPHEMGELFKVMALGRGFDTPLRGFSIQNWRDRL